MGALIRSPDGSPILFATSRIRVLARIRWAGFTREVVAGFMSPLRAVADPLLGKVVRLGAKIRSFGT
ncbi:hypothetical protein A4G28_20775 [Mycobacterium ostraviense]|uniref:Uncharacterized protein n=1 Tax=Mycobacterium ostraviense TaxID=2738409 RepID=A0A164AH63_9MYCO|nr:hypothetical protein A4G28_20775 [Mycobacterium ostraviense]